MTDVALVGLGSNVGDRGAYLNAARTALASLDGSQLLGASSIEETAPYGPVAQGPFLNQMVALAFFHTPLALLIELQRIERRLGRIRHVRWGHRTIDLDLVRFGNERIASSVLTVPHRELASRDFWQREIAELTAIATSGT